VTLAEGASTRRFPGLAVLYSILPVIAAFVCPPAAQPDEEARDFMDDMASASAPTMRWQPPPARYGRAGRRTGKMRSSALFKASALLRSPSRSSSDISGSSTSITPPRPTTLGRDSVTPKLF
jgi:hypothetical protein